MGGAEEFRQRRGSKGPKVLTADMNAAQNATLTLHNVRLEARLRQT